MKDTKYLGTVDSEDTDGEQLHIFEKRTRSDEFSEEIEILEVTTETLAETGANLLIKDELPHQAWERLVEEAERYDKNTKETQTEALENNEFQIGVGNGVPQTIETYYQKEQTVRFALRTIGVDRTDETVSVEVEHHNFLEDVQIGSGHQTDREVVEENGEKTVKEVFKLSLPFKSGKRYTPTLRTRTPHPPDDLRETFRETAEFPQTVTLRVKQDSELVFAQDIEYTRS